LDRSVKHLRDTRLIIIAAEGTETEKQYFSIFRSTRVQLHVLPTPSGDSSLEYVLGRLVMFREEYDLKDDDQLWLLVDVDRWGDGKLAQVSRESRSRGFGLAISHPCFESWLLFHYEERLPRVNKCCDVEARLREAAGGSYNKRRLDGDALFPLVSIAASRARAADPSPDAPWPRAAGSHVYRLVDALPDECLRGS
jgi:hypothetical protein